jgi:hypothetical protein
MPEPQPLREQGIEIRSTDNDFIKLLWEFICRYNAKPGTTRIILLADNLIEEEKAVAR